MYRYDVDEGARLIVAKFEGDVGDADLFNYLSDMLTNTRYGAGWSSLIDLTSAATMKLTSAGVQRMRALPLHMEERLHGARAAILAPEASTTLEMARLYERMGNALYDILVFTDREKAMAWLSSGKSA